MFLTWYEKEVDEKDHIYFKKRIIKQGWKPIRGAQGFHNSIEFAFGLEGKSEIAIGDDVYTIGKGDVVFIDSFSSHRYYYRNGTECYIVLISPSFFNSRNGWGEIKFPAYMPGNENFGIVAEYLDYAIKHFDKASLLCKTAFSDTLAYLMRKYYPCCPKGESGGKDEVFLRVLKYISEHCTEDLTLGDTAKRFGYSANYFSTMFNSFAGTGFRDYLNRCRLSEYMKYREKYPDVAVGKAALACGFGSFKSFYRAYNKFESLS